MTHGCVLTLYWPEGAAAPQDAAAPLLGWAWVAQEQPSGGGGARCTVVVAPAAAACCAGAPLQRVGQWQGGDVARQRAPPPGAAEAWAALAGAPDGVPTLSQLWLRGSLVRDATTVTVLYQARSRSQH